MNKKLTAKTIDALKPTGTRYRIWDTEIKGFHLRISPKGRKSYGLYYRHQGVQKDITLGVHGNITPDQARILAKTEAGKVSSGTDVVSQRKADKAAATKARAETLGAFLKKNYRPWAETNLKSQKETLRMLDVDFAHLHGKKMADITQWDLQKWSAAASKGEGYNSPLSASTINRRTAALKSVLSKAAKWGLIEHSPLAGMERKKTDKQGRVRYLSKTEEKRLRAALQARQKKQQQDRHQYNAWRQARHLAPLPLLHGKYTDYLQPLVLLALNTGMRRGELFNLQWADVDLKGRLLKVQGIGAKSGQTRYTPLNDEAFSILVAWSNQADSEALVFPSPVTGKRLDNINSSWANLMADAGLVNFRFHDCRHHFASQLVMRSVDLNTVRELLGHANIEQTLKYAHLAPEHKAAAVALLNQD